MARPPDNDQTDRRIYLIREAEELGRRLALAENDPIFTEFLIATKRIFMRRTQDRLTRRKDDVSPTSACVKKMIGQRSSIQVMAEFDAWCAATGRQPNRRSAGFADPADGRRG